MKVSDIDIEKIKTILSSIPDGCDVDSINFVNNKIRISFSAGDEELTSEEYEKSLNALNELLKYAQNRENKNYLLINKEGTKP